jgi:hypothetical protein
MNCEICGSDGLSRFLCICRTCIKGLPADLLTENNRLRAALERIAENEVPLPFCAPELAGEKMFQLEWATVMRYAQAVLNGPEVEKEWLAENGEGSVED